jgi:hypothetical protein
MHCLFFLFHLSKNYHIRLFEMIENPEYLKGFNSYAQVHNKTKDSPPPRFWRCCK